MARPRKRIPALVRHKPSNRGRVRINGRDHWLGNWGHDPETPLPLVQKEYDRLIAEHLLRSVGGVEDAPPDRRTISLSVVMARYIAWAKTYYGPAEIHCINAAVRFVRKRHPRLPASDFGPLALKAVREDMVAARLARTTINAQIGRIKRLVKWASENELIDAAQYWQLKTVAGLSKGRSNARETAPVAPVPSRDFHRTMRHVPRPVRALCILQILTGARPGELVQMRPSDLDTSGKIWRYIPERHKSEHHDKRRVIFIGPKGQRVLRAMLPGVKSGDRVFDYLVASYRRAITRACERAGVAPWTPHQLRHSAATSIRASHGAEAAQTILGHSRLSTTEIYAERSDATAKRIAGERG